MSEVRRASLKCLHSLSGIEESIFHPMLQSFTKKAEEIMSDSTYVIQVSIDEAMLFYLMCICDFLCLCLSDESDPQSSSCGLFGVRIIEASVGSETRKHFLLRSPSSVSFEKMVKLS